jgi:hypothetical protein
MAGSIKSVSVVFQAFTDKFEKKVKKAGKTTEGFADKADDAGQSMGGFAKDTNKADQSMGSFLKRAAKFAAGFVAIKSVMNGVTDAIDRLNQIGKISKTLDVSPDFLRGIDLAAADAGESFEKAQDIIKEFNIRMGEAKTGAGPAVNGLAQISKTLNDFEGLSPEESFLKVAEAISNIADEQQKIFVAGEFFGGAGEDMLALLNQGEEGLRKFIQTARELGGPISKEDLKQAEDANLAIKKAGMAYDRMYEVIALKLAPTISTILTDGLEPFLELSNWIAASWNNTAAWVQKVADAMHGIHEEWKEGSMGGFMADLEKAKAAVEQASMDQRLAKLVNNRDRSKDGAKETISVAVRAALAARAISKGIGAAIDGKGTIKEKPEPVFIDTPSFVDAAQAQSSRAFDILNPDKPNSIVNKNAIANEKNEKNTAKIAKMLSNKTTVTVIPGG